MKILILTQYFPPEVGAPQNRLFELALRLQASGEEIEVLTAMPNYPQMKIHAKYKGRWFLKEELGGLPVYRSWIFVRNSKSIVLRLLNYFSFVFSSCFIALFRMKRSDVVFCESPPLFLGITARIICLAKGSRLLFNVSDLWPESAERLGLVKNRLLLGISKKLEEYLYRKSFLITGQTQGIVKDIANRFPSKQVYWLPNGVDLSFYSSSNYDPMVWRRLHGINENAFVCLYAGILGYAQGLDVILEAAERLQSRGEICFIFVGSGPEKGRLQQLASDMKLTRVKFMDVVTKNEMPDVIAASDVSIVPLRKLELFKGAIPSKIFENLAMEKPVLLGIDGEARQLFVEEGQCALYFEPENADSLRSAIEQLANDRVFCKELGKRARIYVEKKFDRNKIAKEFHSLLHSVVPIKM